MFGRFKKKLKKHETEEPKVTEEPQHWVTEKPQTTKKLQATEKPSKNASRSRKTVEDEETSSSKNPRALTDVKAQEKPFIGIKEYSSILEITKSIDHEIAETESSLSGYLRQLADRRAIAEKLQRLHDVVAKIADKKPSKDEPNNVDLNGLEIVLDTIALNELSTIKSVVRSHQQRLTTLQKAREVLQTVDNVGYTEGIKYLALEREGIPEQILLKLS